MKSKVLIMMTVISLLALMIPGVLIASASADIYGNLYPATFIVVGIDQEEDLVFASDFNGMIFSWYGAEDLGVGDIIAAIMNDGCTDTAIDDAVVSVRYAGYIEDWRY